MSEVGRIVGLRPAAAIPGGEVAIECANFDTTRIRTCGAWFEDSRGHLVGVSTRRVLALVPETGSGGIVSVTLESDSQRTTPARLTVGAKLAEDLHLVA